MVKNSIKKIREKKKLTQSEFSNLLGITITTLSRYESGTSKPSKSIKMLMTFSADALRFAEQQAQKAGLL